MLLFWLFSSRCRVVFIFSVSEIAQSCFNLKSTCSVSRWLSSAAELIPSSSFVVGVKISLSQLLECYTRWFNGCNLTVKLNVCIFSHRSIVTFPLKILHCLFYFIFTYLTQFIVYYCLFINFLNVLIYVFFSVHLFILFIILLFIFYLVIYAFI